MDTPTLDVADSRARGERYRQVNCRLLSQCGERSGSGAAASEASRGRLHPEVRRDGSQRAQKVVVFGVGADPEPNDDIAFDDAECAMPEPDPGGVDGPSRVYVLEAEASVLRVLPEAAVGLTRPPLNMLREPAVRFAEATRRP